MACRSILIIHGIGSAEARHDRVVRSPAEIGMTAAGGLAPEKRGVFLQRVAAILMRRHRIGDDDVADAAQLALCGLIQQPAA